MNKIIRVFNKAIRYVLENDENLFWTAVFKSTTKHYILENFLRKLKIE